MNWVVRRLLMLCPAWVAACTVYNQDLLEAGGGSGGTSAGSGAVTGAGASGGAGSVGSGGKPNPSGGSDGDGGTQSSGGTQSGGGSEAGSDGSGGTTGGSSGGSDNSGGSGGTSATGGSSGTGGTGPVKNYTYELIDDFEDGNATGKVTAGRNPMWFLFKDTTAAGVLLPEEIEGAAIPEADAEARPGSTMGLSVSTTGFTVWGSGVGVDFVNPKDGYDGSAYAGIRFYAKATTSYKQVRVNVSQVLTDASQEQCTKCDDHLGAFVNLTNEWKEYKLLFADLTREGWGDPVSELHLDQLLGIMFLVKPNKSVDFWIDDISLMVEEPTPSEANVYP